MKALCQQLLQGRYFMTNRRFLTLALAIFLGGANVTAVSAQEMPAPHRAPRIPVTPVQQDIPASKVVEGVARVIDVDRLKINTSDLYLFGITVPNATLQDRLNALSTLDALADGKNVKCIVVDRNHEGHLLAVCGTEETENLSLEMLRRGLGVAERWHTAGLDAADSYMAAEKAAQSEYLGIWNNVRKKEKQPDPVPNLVSAKPVTAQPVLSEKAGSDMIMDTVNWFVYRNPDLIILSLVLLLWIAAMAMTIRQKNLALREERRTLAAALRGELMAAKRICLARGTLLTVKTPFPSENRAITGTLWPRFRAQLFQANATRLGLLGSELVRQVASIYGQFADYAQLHQVEAKADKDGEARRMAEPFSVGRTLLVLAEHIEIALAALEKVEKTGKACQPTVLAVAAPSKPVAESPAQVTDAQIKEDAAAEEEPHYDDMDWDEDAPKPRRSGSLRAFFKKLMGKR